MISLGNGLFGLNDLADVAFILENNDLSDDLWIRLSRFECEYPLIINLDSEEIIDD